MKYQNTKEHVCELHVFLLLFGISCMILGGDSVYLETICLLEPAQHVMQLFQEVKG
jgi:hypothetical protein